MTTVIAHRGARAFAPENTLEAVALAARIGADAVEIDVQLSKDEIVVVTHDDDLLRCTDVRTRHPDRASWFVSDFTAAEMRALDAGAWYGAQLRRPAPERQAFLRTLADDEIRRWVEVDEAQAAQVPMLDEVLAACRSLGLALHIELKVIPRFPRGLVPRVLAHVHASGMRERVTLSSFDHRQLVEVRARDATIPIAALVRDRLADPVGYLQRLGAQALHPGCIGDADTLGFGSMDGTLDRATIASLRDAGFDVNVWTENDPARMRRLIDAGVTGIFTDYPNRLLDVLGRGASP